MNGQHVIFLTQDDHQLTALRDKLEQYGCECLFFDSPEEALSQIEWLPPDALVVDFDIDALGPHFLETVRDRLEHHLIPTIVITSKIEEDVLAEALELGVADFMSKPVSVGLMKAKLTKLTAQQRDTRTVPKTSRVPRFIGRYRVIDVLGKGGMGVVYRAVHPQTGEHVAIKTMVATTDNLDTLLRFRREIDLLISLKHPNVISVFDTGRAKDVFYYVMEYIRGDCLEDEIRNKGPLSYMQVMDFCKSMADALQHIHELNLVHRDIKPANILICPRKGPILSDFGLSKSKLDNQLTATNQLVGTPHFMAPEYILGQPQTNRSDLFALGMVCLEMLLGRHIFPTDNSYTIMQAIVNSNFPKVGDIERALGVSYPTKFKTIINRLVNIDPKHRFESAAQLERALDFAKADL